MTAPVQGCGMLGMEIRDVAEICIRGMQETAELADVSGVDSIYILHDVYYVSRGHAVRDAVIKRIEEAGGCRS